MVSLSPDYQRFRSVSARLLKIHQDASVLDFQFQKLIAENIMLRLFYELETAVESTALKLVRGTSFLDGIKPALLIPPLRSIEAARGAALNARKSVGKGKGYMKWTMLADINSNMHGILDPLDHFMVTRGLFDTVYEDMRHVRNHLAHNTESTRRPYVALVRRVYVTTQGIDPAKFLLSKRGVVPNYLGGDLAVAQYIRWSGIFLKTLTKSPV